MAPQFKWFSDMPDVCLIVPLRHADARGYFAETYSFADFCLAGITDVFVQDNHSHSKLAGTLRGLHFQNAPEAQAKIVRCVAGSILDVAVDIRVDSPRFGRYVSAELSAENGHQMYIPQGFAHGFVSLVPDCELAYKVSAGFNPDLDAGIDPFDPDLHIEWPFARSACTLSEKDISLPRLKDALAGGRL